MLKPSAFHGHEDTKP